MSALNADGTVHLDDPDDPNRVPPHLHADAIAACDMCDEHAYRADGVVCDHQDHTAMTPGRAAFLAERDRLRQKQVAKVRASGPAQETADA